MSDRVQTIVAGLRSVRPYPHSPMRYTCAMPASLPRLPDSTSVPFGVASAAAFGALNLVDPDRLGARGRLALRLASAATHGVWTAASVDPDTPLVSARTAAGVLAANASWALVGRSWALDRRMAGWLARHGAQHPRRWLAASSALTTLAMLAADRAAARATASGDHPEEPHRTRPLPHAARSVVRRILNAEPSADSAALLTQLDHAEQLLWTDDPDPSAEFTPHLDVRVTGDVPLVVPHSQVYPAGARFDGGDGTTLEVRLFIEDGLLSGVSVERVDGRYDEPVEELLDRWPDPEHLRIVRDSPRGGVVPAD